MLELERLAHELLSGSFETLCPRLEFFPIGSDGLPAASPYLVGSGILRSNKNRELMLDATVDAVADAVVPKDVSTPGTRVADDQHDLLRVTTVDADWSLRDWFQLRFGAEFGRRQISHRCHDLENVSTVPVAGTYASAIVANGGRVPYTTFTHTEVTSGERKLRSSSTRDRHRLSSKRFDLTITQIRADPKLVRIDVQPADGVALSPDRLLDAALAAIDFATARTSKRLAVRTREGGNERLRIVSGPYEDRPCILQPPLSASDPTNWADWWEFVRLFMEYLLSLDDRAAQDICGDLHALRETGGLSLTTTHLLLSTTIESLAKRLLFASPTPPIDAKELDSLLAHVDKWTGDKRLAKRAKGAVEAFSKAGVRAVDLLYAEIESLGLEEDVVELWKKGRDPAAHGARAKDFEVATKQFFASNDLLNRLVGKACEYSGKMSKYSERGWPVADGPKTSSPAASTA